MRAPVAEADKYVCNASEGHRGLDGFDYSNWTAMEYVPDHCVFDTIRASANRLLLRTGGTAGVTAGVTQQGDVRVFVWGDSLSGQLMTALRCMAPIPGLTVDFQRDDMLRRALSWADAGEPARAVLAGCGDELDKCIRQTFDQTGPRLVPSLEAYRRMVHRDPRNDADQDDLDRPPALSALPGCDRNQTDVVIVGTGAHFPSFSSSAKVRLYNETLDALDEFLRDWKTRTPELFVVWYALPTLEFGRPGAAPEHAEKAAKYGWYAFEAKNRVARDRLHGVVDLFLDDRMPRPNPHDAVTKHDGLHACAPGPIPSTLLQVALHGAANFRRTGRRGGRR